MQENIECAILHVLPPPPPISSHHLSHAIIRIVCHWYVRTTSVGLSSGLRSVINSLCMCVPANLGRSLFCPPSDACPVVVPCVYVCPSEQNKYKYSHTINIHVLELFQSKNILYTHMVRATNIHDGQKLPFVGRVQLTVKRLISAQGWEQNTGRVDGTTTPHEFLRSKKCLKPLVGALVSA